MANNWRDETAVVAAIDKAIRKQYPHAWIIKVHGGQYQESGIPDLLICIDGLLIGAEVKHQKPGESHQHAVDRTTPIQRVQIGRINRSGGIAGTVTTPDEALDLIRRAFIKHEALKKESTTP